MADKSLDKGATGLDETPWGHRWGYRDTHFVINPDRTVRVAGNRYAVSGYDMPGFIPFVEEILDIKLDLNDIKQERTDKPVPAPITNQAFVEALAAELPAALLAGNTTTIGLAEATEVAPRLLAGQVRGRVVVDVNR